MHLNCCRTKSAYPLEVERTAVAVELDLAGGFGSPKKKPPARSGAHGGSPLTRVSRPDIQDLTARGGANGGST